MTKILILLALVTACTTDPSVPETPSCEGFEHMAGAYRIKWTYVSGNRATAPGLTDWTELTIIDGYARWTYPGISDMYETGHVSSNDEDAITTIYLGGETPEIVFYQGGNTLSLVDACNGWTADLTTNGEWSATASPVRYNPKTR